MKGTVCPFWEETWWLKCMNLNNVVGECLREEGICDKDDAEKS